MSKKEILNLYFVRRKNLIKDGNIAKMYGHKCLNNGLTFSHIRPSLWTHFKKI